MKQNEINNETMTVEAGKNEVLTINTNEDKFLYDYRETKNNKREFYGFKPYSTGNWFAAYCDEVTLEEFVDRAKEIANGVIECGQKNYTCHGFNPNLLGIPNMEKYTVTAVKGKDTIERSYDNLSIAEKDAIDYLYDDTCEYVSLIDNSTNKGLHFEPYKYALITEHRNGYKTINGFDKLKHAKNLAQACMEYYKGKQSMKIVDAKMNIVVSILIKK